MAPPSGAGLFLGVVIEWQKPLHDSARDGCQGREPGRRWKRGDAYRGV